MTQIRIYYHKDPSDPAEVSRSLIAIQRQFVSAETERRRSSERLDQKWLSSIGDVRKVCLAWKR